MVRLQLVRLPLLPWATFALTLLLFCLGANTRAEPAPEAVASPAAMSGRKTYDANCAACHGIDGRGVKPENTGLDIPLPDFTRCAFSTRETVRDWVGVAHRGGPVRAFDERMPAFGDVLTEKELDATIRYIRTFCKSDEWPPGELNFARGILTEKAFLENEVLLISRVSLEGPIEVAGKLIYEKRVGPRSQIELIAPYGVFRRPDSERKGTKLGRWGKGLGDIALGFKHVAFHELGTGTILAFAGELVIPTGNTGDQIGNGTYIFEPFIAAGQQLSRFGFLHMQAGIGLPFNEAKATKEAYGRLALGRSFVSGSFGRLWTPMFELQMVRELGDQAKTAWDCVPEMQISLSKRRHVRINLGVLIPMTELDARPLQGTGYLMWDWFDGGLDEGW